ncbi:MAG: Fe-S oxidoreductase, partial [Myxococcota bacterium]
DRIHSPKGRAGVMREWLRQLATAGYDPVRTLPWGRWKQVASWPVRAFHTVSRRFGRYDYSTEVYDAMAGCLACKACATQCPVKVDVPSFRARFFDLYHRRYLRPLKDGFVGALEGVLPWMARLPKTTNFLLRRGPVRWLLHRGVGIVDTPQVATDSLRAGLKARGAVWADTTALAARTDAERGRVVVLLQDAFTSFYEPKVVLAAYDLVAALGYEPQVARYFPNGKGLHVKGLLSRFRHRVEKNARVLEALGGLGVPLVAIDPAVGLTYRDEYPETLGRPLSTRVHLIQEWLATAIPETTDKPAGPAFRLLGHCTEVTAEPTSSATWRALFGRVGLSLEPAAAGCCGMSGAYGHESTHRVESEGIFNLSWATHLETPDAAERYLATGFSCRSQAKRLGTAVPRHPVEVLAGRIVPRPEEPTLLESR